MHPQAQLVAPSQFYALNPRILLSVRLYTILVMVDTLFALAGKSSPHIARYWSGTEGRPGLKARLQDAERRVGVFRGQFGSRVWRLKGLKVLEVLRLNRLGLLGSIKP